MTNEERLVSIEAQLKKMWTLHGLPTWEKQEKQRLDNERSRGTRLPFSPSQAHGEVPSGRSVTN